MRGAAWLAVGLVVGGLVAALALGAFSAERGETVLVETPAERAGTAAAPTLATPDESARVRQLEEELRKAAVREAELSERLAKASGGVPPGTGSPAAPGTKGEVPPAVRDAARALAVTDAALEAAYAAHLAFAESSSGTHEALIAALSAQGAEGFRALVALLRGGLNGIWYERLVAATWRPGLEDLLLDVAEDASVATFSRWSALSALGAADTRRVRDYLADRVAREEDAGLYFSAATALGRLHETSWASTLDLEKLLRPGWSGVRGHVLSSLGETGGADAARALLRYARHPEADKLDWALRALSRIDPAAARTEARALLASDRAASLDPLVRATIESIARG